MEIYMARLNDFLGLSVDWAGFLPACDLAELAKISGPKAKRQKIVTKFFTRYVLAQKLNVGLQNICFYKNDHGKPYVKGNPVFFNVSHSNDLIGVAVSNSEVGLDVEYMKTRDFAALAQSCFCERVVDEIRSAKDMKQAFYRNWTAYEAKVKLNGGELFGVTDAKPVCLETWFIEDYMLTAAAFDPFTITINEITAAACLNAVKCS